MDLPDQYINHSDDLISTTLNNVQRRIQAILTKHPDKSDQEPHTHMFKTTHIQIHDRHVIPARLQ